MKQLVVIGGVSGSGKSTVVAELSQDLGAEHLALDHFQKPSDECAVDPDGYIDWEDPANRDVVALLAAIESIWERDQSECIFVEGHTALAYPELREVASLAIFFASEHPDRESFRQQHSNDPVYEERYFHPGEQRHILPTQEHADITIDTGSIGLEAATSLVRLAVALDKSRSS